MYKLDKLYAQSPFNLGSDGDNAYRDMIDNHCRCCGVKLNDKETEQGNKCFNCIKGNCSYCHNTKEV